MLGKALPCKTWSAWPTFEQGQTCTWSSDAAYLSGGLCLYERLYVRNLLWAFFKKKKKKNHHIALPLVRWGEGCFPTVPVPQAVSVLHSSFPPRCLLRLLTSCWKFSASLCPRSVPMVSGLLFTCAVFSQEQHLHTWLTSLRCTPHSTAGSFALSYCPSLWGGPSCCS